MFVIKKLIGHFLMPLPLGLVFLTLGLVLLLRRRRLCGWGALTFGWLVLVVTSNRGVSSALTSSLESTYAPVPPALAVAEPKDGAPAAGDVASIWPPELRDAAFVAVLGGGHGDARALSSGQRLSNSARARLVEGVRIALALPETRLVVSGPDNGGQPDVDEPPPQTHARVLADAAVELGFPRERIVEIDTARDTAEEVVALRLLAGTERIALVTSAWHLPRAMQLARHEGLEVFPCPADYLGGTIARVGALDWLTWDGESLTNTTRAWREHLGRAWARFVAWWRG
mgnify:FL=1|jgi:Uncharacterized conserved protein